MVAADSSTVFFASAAVSVTFNPLNGLNIYQELLRLVKLVIKRRGQPEIGDGNTVDAFR